MRETAVSIPIPIKEIIWIHLFELCVYKVKPFSYHSDTFRSSGYSSDHTDNLQIIWTLFESSGFAKTSRSVLLTLWLWASNVKFSNIKSGLNTLSTMQCITLKGFCLALCLSALFLRAQNTAHKVGDSRKAQIQWICNLVLHIVCTILYHTRNLGKRFA